MLELLPCLDSAARAEALRRSLDTPRARTLERVRAAVEVLARGRCGPLDLSVALPAARAARRSLPPEVALPPPSPRRFATTRVQVANESTFVAGRRLRDATGSPLLLNFANGTTPGGGFLHGARAQEESLCRLSGLYLTLDGDPMYAHHARHGATATATDWCILSPDVPFFFDDDGAVLSEVLLLSVLTCAAPIAFELGPGVARALLRQRITRVLAVAEAFGYARLVLGAWGCGAFGNDPGTTARDFRDALQGPFAGAFEEVVFAIADWSPERRFLGPFCEAFTP